MALTGGHVQKVLRIKLVIPVQVLVGHVSTAYTLNASHVLTVNNIPRVAIRAEMPVSVKAILMETRIRTELMLQPSSSILAGVPLVTPVLTTFSVTEILTVTEM